MLRRQGRLVTPLLERQSSDGAVQLYQGIGLEISQPSSFAIRGKNHDFKMT